MEREVIELLLSQPEIVAWLELSEPEIVAWLRPDESKDDDEPSRRTSVEPSTTARSRQATETTDDSLRHAGVITLEHGPTLLVRPLRDGDVGTVTAVFDRLGEQSRRARFNGPKRRLSASELQQLAVVDRRQHALVAYVEGDPHPVAIARLVRDGHTAEVAFAVADEYQRRGIGSALAAELVADARTAGITEITALVSSDNPAGVALLRRIANVLHVRLEGPELSIRAAIA